MSATFHRLLLATEHSEFDIGSERLALALAQRCGLGLTVVLPLRSNPEYEAVAPQLAAQAEAQAAASLAELAQAAAAAGVSWHAVVRRGSLLSSEIVDEARARGTDLLVIRRRGRIGRLANLLVGEMVGQVLAHAPCSVLTVSRQAAMWSRQVLVAVDPAAPDAAAIDQGSAIAAEFALPLRLVAVAEGMPAGLAEAALAQALAQARRIAPQARADLLQGKAHGQLIAAALRLGADLIVVGRHGEGGFAQAWLGGAAQKVIGLADCAVLVAVARPPESGDSAEVKSLA